MVATRRSSRTTAEDGNSADQDAVAEPLTQLPEVSSRRTRKSTAAAAAHVVLEPVTEEPAAAAACAPAAAACAPAAASQEEEQIIPTQELPQQNEQYHETEQQPQQQPQHVRHYPAPAQQHIEQQPQQQPRQKVVKHSQQPQQQQPPVRAQAAVGDDNDSDSDWDFDGPDMLQNLAASIRAALGTAAGDKQQKHQRQKHAAVTAVARVDDSDDVNPEGLRWRPATGLQLPPKIGQLVHRAAAALPPKQQQELAAAGPQVDNPAAAAAATDVYTTADVQTQEAGAAVTKPKGLAKHTRVPTLDPTTAAKEARKAKPDTAGKQWYDLPAVKVTDAVKRDLRLLRLRGAYDPKRFYRSFDETKFPKHFAVGTVVDDPLDFYGGRLSKGQRKASLTEQLLADSELTHSRKKRYSKLQEDANKWVKHKKRKTDMPRKTPSKHKPKH